MTLLIFSYVFFAFVLAKAGLAVSDGAPSLAFFLAPQVSNNQISETIPNNHP
jgi:hypothetical protein